MKKGTILELIRAHADGSEPAFRTAAYAIAREFDETGDTELAQYIMAQLGGTDVFEVPDDAGGDASLQLSEAFSKVPLPQDPMLVPRAIEEDVLAIARVAKQPVGVHKFLFHGAPGTGKTEAVKQIARLLGRDLYAADFAMVVDSKLGQTAKNISALFDEMNRAASQRNVLFLFDELDSLALDRTSQQDVREMGRATSTVLRKLDQLHENAVLFATTNLIEHFDKALLRRFDALVDFNRYLEEDLLDIADRLADFYLDKFKRRGRKPAFLRKILKLRKPIPYPGELKNLLRRAVAFSDGEAEGSYLKRVYAEIAGEVPKDILVLREQGFTVREIELLTDCSKSQVSRNLRKRMHDSGHA